MGSRREAEGSGESHSGPAPELAALAARVSGYALLPKERREFEAAAIREEAARWPVGDGPLADPALRVIARFQKACGEKDRSRRRLYEPAKLLAEPALAALVAPFLGAPGLDWPYASPLRAPSTEAEAWLELLGAHAVPDATMLDFVETFLELRSRNDWRPAARALGRLAARNEAALERLQSHWGAAFDGKGLPDSWPQARWKAKDLHHMRRHLLTAAGAFFAAGGAAQALPGFEPARLLTRALPKDAADSSAFLLGIAELATSHEGRALVAPQVGARLAGLSADFQNAEAVRQLYESFGSFEDHAAVRVALTAWLIAPGWRAAEYPDQVDQLHGWLETARWLQDHDPGALPGMRESAPEVQKAFDLAVGARDRLGPDLAADLVEELAILLAGDIRETTPMARRSLAVEAAGRLMEHAELRDLPWEAFERRAAMRTGTAGDAGAPVARGPVRMAGPSRLLTALGSTGMGGREQQVPRTLLHDRTLDEAAVLFLARSQNPSTATQAAVQLERLLREKASADEQVKLLWRVLQQDPCARLFEELARVIRKPRGGEARILGVLAAIRELDELEDGEEADPAPAPEVEVQRRARIAAAYGKLARVAEEYILGAETGREGAVHYRELASVADRFGSELRGALGQAGTERWAEGFEKLLRNAEAVANWVDPRTVHLGPALDDFLVAMKAVRSPLPRIAECDALDDASGRLRSLAAALPRPELRFALASLASADSWRADRRARMEEARAELTRVLERGDEEAAKGIAANSEKTQLLDGDGAARLHGFLLDQYLFAEAEGLRRQLLGKKSLPTRMSRMLPLAAAVAGGIMLLLNFKDIWIELQEKAGGLRLLVTSVVLVASTYALLAFEVGQRMRGTGLGWRDVARRVLPVVLGAYLYSMGITTVVLLGLIGTSLGPNDSLARFATRVLVWAALGLFLGVVVDRAMQGKKITQAAE